MSEVRLINRISLIAYLLFSLLSSYLLRLLLLLFFTELGPEDVNFNWRNTTWLQSGNHMN